MSYINEHYDHVQEGWIDYNGHMNVAYYVLVFDHATDDVLDGLGLGEAYRKSENKSFFVVESHITYDQEVKKGDPLLVKTKILGFDNKRLHMFHEMYHRETMEKCATNEIMTLHVDMVERKTTQISEVYSDRLNDALSLSRGIDAPLDSGRSIKKLVGK